MKEIKIKKVFNTVDELNNSEEYKQLWEGFHMDNEVQIEKASCFISISNLDKFIFDNFKDSFRAYLTGSNRIALQIRTHQPLIRRGKPHNMLAHVELNAADARKLVSLIETYLKEFDTTEGRD